MPNAEIFAISALENFGVPEVFKRIIDLLPQSPAFYPKDQLTDKPERFFVNETIQRKNTNALQKRNSLQRRDRDRRVL